jgi:HSP20 family protein
MWGNGRSTQAFGGQISAFFPDVDINESDDKIELTAELPGMKDKDIKLDLSRDGDVLSIEGEKRSEVERREGEVFCSERRFGRFRRTVALPGRVDPDKVKARYQDGVLRVEMTRAPEPEQGTRRIAVKTG